MKAVLLASSGMAMLVLPAMGQAPATTQPPNDAAACMALLNSIGPKLTSVREGKTIAEIKSKGAQMAALCQQQKFKDAALVNDAISILLGRNQ